MRRLLTALARLAVGVPFIVLGSNLVRRPDPLAPVVERSGLPLPVDARTAVLVNGAAMMAGGAAVATGLAPRVGALTVAAMLGPTTYAGHPFWKREDPVKRMIARNELLKNVALAGGLIAVAALEHRASRR